MARSGSTGRRLQSAAACLLTVTGLTAPASSGLAGSPPAAEGGDTAVRARTVGAVAPAPWHADPLREAVEGAAQRLANPSCAALLQDFTGLRGEPLSARLAQIGSTPSDYARAVLFNPGFDESACRANRQAYAFTVPGGAVVRVCRPLPVLARSRPELAQAIVIHEVLHTLGLGENPPSSHEITSRVMKRCFVDP